MEANLAREMGLSESDPEKPLSLGDVDSVVMIQCVGPAEEYCARICCSSALKNALLLKRFKPSMQITILHRDIRTYGFKERLYRQALDSGILFVRYDEDRKPDVGTNDGTGRLGVRVWDAVLGRVISLAPDLLILSTPLVPAQGNRALGTTLKVPVDMDGWFLEAHVKLRPVDFTSDGIYLAGVAHYPKLLDEAIVQAQAAAARATTILSRESLSSGGAVAHVDPQACVGCLTCVRICPYGIPKISSDALGVGGFAGIASIEPTICQGCGTCVAECPAYAIELSHYRHDQVEREVLSLFKVETKPPGGEE
jgi:heterodisulfide reductase subunit A-like polyferredoxin